MPRRGKTVRLRKPLLALALTLLSATVAAGELPVVAIVIDDLGHRTELGHRVLELPGPVALAILPHTPHGPSLAYEAATRGREVLLHLPMQATEPGPLGPGALTLDMGESALAETLDAALRTVPSASGVNNHMGSLLTRHPGHMTLLMRELKSRRLYFLDSRTTTATVAEAMAHEQGLPALRRDIFLDGDGHDAAFVRRQLARLIEVAHHNGHAVAIGHPIETTLSALEEFLPVAESTHGVHVVPVARVIAAKEQGRTPWQASLFPSPKTSRTSRPSP